MTNWYDFLSAPTGVTNLMDTPSLSQIHLTWNKLPRDNTTGVITRYEVLFGNTKSFTGEATYTTNHLLHGTNYTVLVTTFSLFGRGPTLERTIQTLSEARKF